MNEADQKNAGPWTIRRLLAWTTQHFERHQVDEPRLAAELLLSNALACKRIELYTRIDEAPNPNQLNTFRDAVRKAADHVPVAYLIGFREFFSLEFRVTPAVLIPRPETEVLVQQTIEFARTRNDGRVHLLDLGTGSGCVIVSALKYLPSASGVATDISGEALAVARENAERHGVTQRIRFVEADRLNLPPDCVPDAGFDAIISNPPYITAAELQSLPRGVVAHEPRVALTDESDGLSFFRSVADNAPDLLESNGTVLLEIAEDQAAAVLNIFASTGRYIHAGTWKDTIGPHDRVMRFDQRLSESEGG